MTSLAWRSLEDVRGGRPPHATVGDIVRTGQNFHPHYRVIAVSADRAWIRDVQRGTDHVIPVDRCSRIDDRKSAERFGSSDE